MRMTQLGRSGLEVSRLCLGTMNFGPYTTPEDSHAILDHGRETGVNFVDTANVYGRHAGKGATEKILGDWFAQGNRRREDTVLCTKVYAPMGDGPNNRRLSARHIKMACEDSLRRLKTDWIDVYQMHHVDRNTPWDEIWQAMDQLVREGKILYVGSSNFAAWHIVDCNHVAASRGSLGLVSEQSIYHLNNRTIELEVLPACRAKGVGVIAWSPLGSGLLAGGHTDNQGRRSKPFVQERLEKARPQVEAYEALCAELGHPPAEVALAWVLSNDAITAPIVGPRTLEQLLSAQRAVELSLDAETLKRLDAIFPGPGGAAPEAYAW